MLSSHLPLFLSVSQCVYLDCIFFFSLYSAQPQHKMKDVKKYLVYEDCLLSIFHHCPVCTCICKVKTTVRGTYLSVQQSCPRCEFHRRWDSQPIIGSTPAGNLQLSAAICFTGSSFTQVNKVGKHIYCMYVYLQDFSG